MPGETLAAVTSLVGQQMFLAVVHTEIVTEENTWAGLCHVKYLQQLHFVVITRVVERNNSLLQNLNGYNII